MTEVWRTARATMIRNQLSNLRAYPWSFTFGHILNGSFLVLVSYFIYHYWMEGELAASFTRYSGSSDYMTFAVIGGLLSTLSVSMIMNVSRALITEHREGTLEVVLLAPAGRTGYFLGTAMQQLARVLLEAVPVVILGGLVGARMPHAEWMSAIAALLLYLGACFAMALSLGAVMLHTRDTYLVQNTLFSATTLLCGFLFPTAYLPEPLRLVGYIFPLTDGLQLLRGSLLNGSTLWQQSDAVARCMVLIAVYSLLGSWFIGKTERRFFEKWH
jgi:ABC-2 type transport system permease protein